MTNLYLLFIRKYRREHTFPAGRAERGLPSKFDIKCSTDSQDREETPSARNRLTQDKNYGVIDESVYR